MSGCEVFGVRAELRQAFLFASAFEGGCVLWRATHAEDETFAVAVHVARRTFVRTKVAKRGIACLPR